MAAAAKTTSKASAGGSDVLLYRLEQVETKVDGINTKLDTRQNLTREDLVEFRERLFERLASMQKEIDEKADKTEVAALWLAIKEQKGLIKAIGALFGSALVGIVVYYLTTGSK